MEGEASVAGAFDAVAVVVGAVVVPGAEQEPIGEIGAPAGGPGRGGMVSLAPGSRDIAAFRAAGDVADRHRLALGGAEQAAGAAEVEELGLAAQHGGKKVGRAGQSAGLAGGDRGVTDQGGAEAVT